VPGTKCLRTTTKTAQSDVPLHYQKGSGSERNNIQLEKKKPGGGGTTRRTSTTNKGKSTEILQLWIRGKNRKQGQKRTSTKKKVCMQRCKVKKKRRKWKKRRIEESTEGAGGPNTKLQKKKEQGGADRKNLHPGKDCTGPVAAAQHNEAKKK